MRLPGKNDVLRGALEALEHLGLTCEEHRDAVELLRPIHAHTIRFLEGRRDETCVLFALSLTDQSEYRELAEIDIYAGKQFMHWVTPRLTEITAPKPGCLIHYYAADEWQHVGVMQSLSRVESKWGTFGRFEHELWEVPADYGDQLVFHERPTPEQSLGLFLDYADAHYG